MIPSYDAVRETGSKINIFVEIIIKTTLVITARTSMQDRHSVAYFLMISLLVIRGGNEIQLHMYIFRKMV